MTPQTGPPTLMVQSITSHERPWKRSRWVVPPHDEALLCAPPLAEAAALIQRNRELLQAGQRNLQGRTLEHLRHWTRHEALRAAREYTSGLVGETIDERPFETVVVAGHQPSLFHPGVWVKNFLIGHLAAENAGIALNLVIDNDVSASTRLKIPAGDLAHPARGMIAFDAERPAMPWEEAEVVDRAIFDSFGRRVEEAMSSWGIRPLGAEIWPDAVRALDHSPLVGHALSCARSCLERRWGLDNLELPISRLCTLDPFLWFASHILAHLPAFRTIYNEVLWEYRRFNRIRSHTHPVPELRSEGEWLEAPLWVWRQGEHVRRPVMARQAAGTVILSDGRDEFCRLPLAPEKEACCAVEALREIQNQGWRIRTRALTTTLFARLCLGDVFVHGIGGAKYDEITDRLIARFFEMPAPDFVTASATVHLPLRDWHSKDSGPADPRGPFDVTEEDATRLEVVLRDLVYNSDRHISPGLDPEADALIAEKQRLIAERPEIRENLSHAERRARAAENKRRYLRFREISSKLAEKTPEQRERIENELELVRRQLDANAIIRDREYSFCLYPAEKLRGFLTSIAEQAD